MFGASEDDEDVNEEEDEDVTLGETDTTGVKPEELIIINYTELLQVPTLNSFFNWNKVRNGIFSCLMVSGSNLMELE